MRSRFLLLPVASIVASIPAHAAVYLTVELAQALMFPGASLGADFRVLTREHVAAIEKASGVRVRDRTLKAWRASTGGWFLVDEVLGKHEFIPFALALGPDGAVRGVEILEYHEAYGDQIRIPAWRAQFVGKRPGAKLELDRDIRNISGATLSCRHLTDGVKRLLAAYAVVLGPAGG
jgi:hypothetical protein